MSKHINVAHISRYLGSPARKAQFINMTLLNFVLQERGRYCEKESRYRWLQEGC